MAYSDRNPEIYLEYRGIVVGHTYKYDDDPDEDYGDGSDHWDNQRMSYWFQVDGEKFDVRNIDLSEVSAADEDCPDDFELIMRRAIDAGIDLGVPG